MRRLVMVAMLLLLSSHAAHAQTLRVLHIRITLVDAEQKATPVPRHVLLVSDNPSSAPPRQVVTALDGTADIKLRPGNYTVESDRPVVFHGKAYQWTQIVDIAAGRDGVLELTPDNAEIESAPAADAAASFEVDPLFVLPQWQDSVVALWTPTAHASGFVIDARGLIATNQRVIGTAASVEAQLSPTLKVVAHVLAADQTRDVAVLHIDPGSIASIRPVPLGCAQATKPTVVDGQKLFTIGAPLNEQKGITSGTVNGVEPHAITSDVFVAAGSAGGPVFIADGGVVGLTSLADDDFQSRHSTSRVVPIRDACDVLASAEKKLKDAVPTAATRLPVEPTRPFPISALTEATKGRAGSLNPYQMSSSDFDIAFITPVLIYGAQHMSEQVSSRGRGASQRPPTPDAEMSVVRPLMDFRNWSEYVAAYPPVVLIRVTPKAVEGFWTTVARGAARTQGVALPPIKHVKTDFSHMRVFCGETEVTPIHPFKLEQRVSETTAVYEGLYVFGPDELGPPCGTVKLMLYSTKEPDKVDSRMVDPNVLQQIWQDFALYREP